MSQLTTAEAVKMLGIAEATLNEWRIRGEEPTYNKMDRLVCYPEYEVQRYISERTIETSSPILGSPIGGLSRKCR